MDNYMLEQVNALTNDRIEQKTWLVVHKLHRTPYHIGLIHKDFYYSLTVSGVEIKPKQEMLASLLDKTYNNLLVELKTGQAISEERTREIFSATPLNHQQFFSCLFPVREFMTESTANNHYVQANNLFDLLDLLKKDNLAGEKMATRMTPPMESKIVLMRYDQETIRKHIKRLEELNNREGTGKNL